MKVFIIHLFVSLFCLSVSLFLPRHNCHTIGPLNIILLQQDILVPINVHITPFLNSVKPPKNSETGESGKYHPDTSSADNSYHNERLVLSSATCFMWF